MTEGSQVLSWEEMMSVQATYPPEQQVRRLQDNATAT
jgi:hypothetical protein